MRDYDAVFTACEGVDCVFHVAACGMSGLEQASTIFLTFSFITLVKAKICLHVAKNVIIYLCQTKVSHKGQIIPT